MKFFDKNFLFITEGGTSGSSTGFSEYAFDDNKRYCWVSAEQDTDGELAYVERYLDYKVKFDSLIITKTNIDDLTLWYKIDGDEEADPWRAWTFTINTTASNDGLSHYLELNMTEYITGIRIGGTNTIVADEEKEICSIYGFDEVGEIIGFDKVHPTKNRNQKKNTVQNGGTFIANKGYHWNIKLSLKGVTTEEDTNTFETLRGYERQFYIWINGGFDTLQKVRQEPYLFEDVIKVSLFGKNSPRYYKEFFNLGIIDTITMYEAGKLY